MICPGSHHSSVLPTGMPDMVSEGRGNVDTHITAQASRLKPLLSKLQTHLQQCLHAKIIPQSLKQGSGIQH